MAIKHKRVVASGDKGYAVDWNDDHEIEEGTGIKGAVTLVVAASNTTDKTAADYICDGTEDESQINQAITNLPATGGRVMLLEGTYSISNPIVISKSYVTLMGMGRSSKIETTQDVPMISCAAWNSPVISMLWLYGAAGACTTNNGVYFSAVQWGIIKDCWIDNCGSNGIELSAGAYNLVHNCIITTAINFGLCMSNSTAKNKITGCIIRGNMNAVTIQSGSWYNALSACQITNNNGYGVRITGAADYNIITGSHIAYNVWHGVFIDGSPGNVITNNVIRHNDINNTASYDGICIDNNSDFNVVVGNRVGENDRWEINIDQADCERNLVVANNLFGVDHVGCIQNNGTASEVAHNLTFP